MNKKISAIIGAIIIFSAANLVFPAVTGDVAVARAAALSPGLAIKSVDVMKYTKDVMTSQPSEAQIQDIVATLKTLGVGYIAMSVPLDPTSEYPPQSAPAPSTAEAFTQEWADAIHNAGLKIIWRGTFSGLEGLYGFTQLVGPNRPITDDGVWLGKTYEYITLHPGYFANGDIWAPLPERTQGLFTDSTSFLLPTAAGLQANYANFFDDIKRVSDAAFATIGKDVTTGMTSNNASEALSGWLPQSIYDESGDVVVDYYGTTHTPQEMDHDLRAMSAAAGKPIFLQEWSDYWDEGMATSTRLAYLTSMYTEMDQLVSDGVLAGFNYWGGWDNDAEGILTQDASGNYQLNAEGQLLQSFFNGTLSTTQGNLGNNGSGTTASSTGQNLPDVLGGLDLGSYCASLGEGGAGAANGSWSCTAGGQPIDMTQACIWQYGNPADVAEQGTPANQSSWSCAEGQ